MGTQLSDKEKQKILEKAMAQVYLYMKQYYPWLFLVYRETTGTKSGTVSFTLRVFNGEVQDVVVHNQARRYKVDPKKGGEKSS